MRPDNGYQRNMYRGEILSQCERFNDLTEDLDKFCKGLREGF